MFSSNQGLRNGGTTASEMKQGRKTSKMTITEKQNTTRKNASQGLRDYAMLGSLGYQLLAAILLCFGIGYGLDYIVGTKPILTVVFGVVGIGAGLLLVFRSTKNYSTKKTKRT
jgi:ATP synthase protein I